MDLSSLSRLSHASIIMYNGQLLPSLILLPPSPPLQLSLRTARIVFPACSAFPGRRRSLPDLHLRPPAHSDPFVLRRLRLVCHLCFPTLSSLVCIHRPVQSSLFTNPQLCIPPFSLPWFASSFIAGRQCPLAGVADRRVFRFPHAVVVVLDPPRCPVRRLVRSVMLLYILARLAACSTPLVFDLDRIILLLNSAPPSDRSTVRLSRQQDLELSSFLMRGFLI